MKKYVFKILSFFLVTVIVSSMISCDLGSILEDIAPDDLGNGVENGIGEEPKFTLEATESTKETEQSEDTREETETSRPKDTEEAEDNDNTSSNTAVIPTDPLDFEGEEVVIIYRDHIQNSREWYKTSPEDELDEAISMRNSACESTLNIRMAFEPIASNGNDYSEYTARFQNLVMTDIDCNLHYYDISANMASCSTFLSIRDYAANLLDEAVFPYFNFSLPCWNQSIIENATVNNRLFYVASDVNLSVFDSACVIWHNKTLYDRYKEPTDHQNIQDLAIQGMWTYEELYKWSQRLYEDSNGVAGKQSNDTFGFATQTANTNAQSGPKDALLAAFNIDLISTNYDGTHSYNIIGNDKAAKTRTMWINLFKAKGTTDNGSVANFATGKYLFWSSTLYSNAQDNMIIREMDDKYGLLPMPKYDVSQAEYGTTAQDYYTLMFVLDHSKSDAGIKGEAVSVLLELLSENSSVSVRGYYFDRIIKPKYFGKDDTEGTVTKSIALFDVIVSNIEIGFVDIYSQQLDNFKTLWRNSLHEEYNTLENSYRALKTSYDKSLKDLDTWFGLK